MQNFISTASLDFAIFYRDFLTARLNDVIPPKDVPFEGYVDN